MCKGCIGSWIYAIGLLIAIILGAFGPVTYYVGLVLLIISVIMGILGLTEREVKPYIHAGVVVAIIAGFTKSMIAVALIQNILHALVYVTVPATLILVLRSVFVGHHKKH